MDEKAKTRTKSGQVRMEEVARVAGVSLATVSRALRNPDQVSQARRDRVHSAVERLNYTPNPVAGSLSGAKTPLVGVIVPSLTNSFFAGTLERMASVLEQHGFQVMIGHHEYDPAREERIISAFVGWNPSALVVTGVDHSRGAVGILSAATCPVIEMWDLDGRPLDTIVGFSNAGAGRAGAAHFAKLGYRRVAFVGATLGKDPRAQARARAFAEEFKRLTGAGGATGATALTVDVDGRDSGDGAIGLARVLAQQPDVQAIAFSGDMLAIGAMFEAQRRGISIPNDLALLGYGDLEIATQTNPGLSTIRPPRDEIGAAVAQHILDRLKDPGAQGVVIDLGISIVERGSG